MAGSLLDLRRGFGLCGISRVSSLGKVIAGGRVVLFSPFSAFSWDRYDVFRQSIYGPKKLSMPPFIIQKNVPTWLEGLSITFKCKNVSEHHDWKLDEDSHQHSLGLFPGLLQSKLQK